MVSLTCVQKLIAGLPKTLEMPNGDVLPVRVRTMPTQEQPPGTVTVDPDAPSGSGDYPLITLRDTGSVEGEGSPLGGYFGLDTTTTSTQVEAHTYMAGTTDYLVVERDVASITSITGLVSGIAHTFLQGSDYSLTQTTFPLDVPCNDTVHWLNGVRPDNATSFTVTYQSFTPTERRGEEVETTFDVYFHTRNHAAGEVLRDPRTGANMAALQSDWHREDVMRHLEVVLAVFWKNGLPNALVGTAVVRRRGPVVEPLWFEGRGVMVKHFELVLAERLDDVQVFRSLVHAVSTTNVST